MITYKSAMPVMTLKYRPSEYKKTKVIDSTTLYSVFKNHFDPDTVEYREEMLVVYMNSANNTIGVTKHSFGGTGSTIVDVKVILTEALLCGATSIALAHNHPSCQLQPSREDEKVTQRVKIGCEAVGIRLLDHIIVAGDFSGYYSFLDEGKF